jgi:hypothetical protein
MRYRRLVVLIGSTLSMGACAIVTPQSPAANPGRAATRPVCVGHIARAHQALAAPHGPAGIGVSAAAHGHAMHQYHACLANPGS